MTAANIGTPGAIAGRGILGLLRERPTRPTALGVGLCLPFFAMMGVLVAYPIVKLILTLTQSPGLSANVASFFSVRLNVTSLGVTLLDSLVVTAVVLVFGSIIAWSMVTTRRPAVRLVLVSAVTVPLLMNSIVKVFAFTVLLQRYGVVNTILLRLHIVQSPLSLLYNQFAAIIGMVYYMLPWAVLPLYVAFLSLDLDLPAAAASLGASRIRALRDTCLPLALPGIFATAVIDYAICLGFFVVPLFLGGTSTPFTANLIWSDISTFYNFSGAAASSTALLIAATVVVIAGYLGVGRERLVRAVA